MRKLVKVTREDIRAGQQGESDSCPVAIAVNRTLPYTNFKAIVASHCIFLKGHSVNMPPDLQAWIKGYDSSLDLDEVPPVEFSIIFGEERAYIRGFRTSL